MELNLKKVINDVYNRMDFSGSVLVKDHSNLLVEESFGYANRADQLKNNTETRFGIASGCKLLTSIAVCRLVDDGQLTFDTKMSQCLDFDLKYIDKEITVHHLLTHTSGIPDYFDEEVMEDFEALWVHLPMYHLRRVRDFLPLFQNEQMKFHPGERFHYNNAGYILLGLIVEQMSGIEFSDYVKTNVFNKADMEDSGYFSFDSLPANTAIGYIDDADGGWKTNIYSLPVKGGPDGGAFVTVHDMMILWDALLKNKLLSEKITETLLSAHAQINKDDFYGYGIWIKEIGDRPFKYHLMGYDPGVNFHFAHYPEWAVKVAICSNKSNGAYEMMMAIEEELKTLGEKNGI